MKRIFLFYLAIITVSCAEKEIYRFEVQEGGGILNATPIAIDLSNIKFDNFALYQDGKKVSCQIDSTSNKLWFVHPADRSSNYSIEKVTTTGEGMTKELSATKKNGNLQLSIENKPVLQYRYEMHYPPQGIDSSYRKSGYIHPLLTPKGDTLTRINPPDHNHHYGIWGPWTHTRIDTMRVDFWNLLFRQGTVLFKEFNSISSGTEFSGFDAIQEHIDFKTKAAAQVALSENLSVTLWSLNRADRYMFDYTTTFSTPLEKGILFEAYRYGGGIGMRFTERWKADNCSVLTSEGKNRLSADGSNARWCIVSGESSDGKGANGVLFMSHPKNRMHPEPMRVWPIDGNGGRGDMFFEFCPIRNEEWKIEPKKDYQLNYRMVVFDGGLSVKEAEAYWQTFANPPQMRPVSN